MWERIFYGEFDGRRRKRVLVKIVGEWWQSERSWRSWSMSHEATVVEPPGSLAPLIGKVVVSDSPTSCQTAPWHNTRIIRRPDTHKQIAALKRQTGQDILVFGSRTLWNDLLRHDLVDELHLMIGPVGCTGCWQTGIRWSAGSFAPLQGSSRWN